MDSWNFKINVVLRGDNTECLGVKEETYWSFVEIDKYIYPILHYQINLGNKIFDNLLDYGNKYIKKVSVKEDIAQNSLLVFNYSIDEKIKLRK